MNPIYTLPLLSPDSGDGFRTLHLHGEIPGPSAVSGTWSVRSYVLHGGLQEGVQVVEVDNGRLSFAILPTRGMSLWRGQCGEVALGWDSPVQRPVHPAFIDLQDRGGLGFLKGFNEWFVRCGLNSMGPPGLDTGVDNNGNSVETQLTLHGKIANLPAHLVSVEVTDRAITIRGEVDETMMLGPALRLATEIRTEFGSGAVTITDTVTNLGDQPAEHEMLYHINYGPPLLEKGSRLVLPFKQVAPRDARAAEGIENHNSYGPAEPGFVEQVYFYEPVGKRGSRETLAMLRNAAGDRASLLRYSLKDFPTFTLWKNTAGLSDGYVTGLEPATSFPNPRCFEREQGRVLSLAGGESRTTRMTIETLETRLAVEEAEGAIAKLQSTAKSAVHPHPVARLSPG